jgi:hypothetical protein
MTTVQRGARLRRSSFYEATQRYGPNRDLPFFDPEKQIPKS